jgi:hypothetical protein
MQQWADSHRELIIMGVALPLGTLAAGLQNVRRRFAAPITSDEHDARVVRVIADVKRYAEARRRGDPSAQKLLRTDRKGIASLNTRVTDKSQSQTVRMGDLRAILGVDRGRGVIRLEPFATVGDVARHLDEMGLQLEATIEMKDATLGGLVMALGMTTHSHVCGLVHDTVPGAHFAGMVELVHDELEIYPLLAYPCKVIDRGGLVRLPSNRGKPYSGRPETGPFLDLGIYGIPQRIKEGDTRFPTVTKVRKLEQKVRSLGGFLHTYCDVFSTEEEFTEMFDHTLWRRMRAKYGAEGTFPTIYEKVKPEVDPLQFLAEERSWAAPLR